MTVESNMASVQQVGVKRHDLEETDIFEHARPDAGETLPGRGFHEIAKQSGPNFVSGHMTMVEDKIASQTVTENF